MHLTGQKKKIYKGVVGSMNPMSMMKIKGLMSGFAANHPKVPAFFKAASDSIGVDSVIEISVTTADGKTLCTNMKVKPEDVQLVEELKNIVK